MLRAIRDEHEIIPMIETWRELSKLKSTYLDSLPALISPRRPGGCTRPSTRPRRPRAGCRAPNPNLQNIPIRTELGRQIRSCFIAEEGCRLISADYSQVELRILAHVAGEQVLKQIFERGEDVHAATAAEVLKLAPDEIGPGERSRAKAVNFGIVYGLSAHGLSEQLDIPHEEAAEYIERYLGRFPAVRKFIERTIVEATDRGLRDDAVRPPPRHPRAALAQVPDALAGRAAGGQHDHPGHRRGHHQDRDGPLRRARCARRACATRLVLTIHDELLFEGPEAEVEQATALVRREMEGAFELDPPLVVDVGVGENWMDAK